VSLDFDLIQLLGASNNKIHVDAGANIGEFTARLTRLFPQASIVAFEPVPQAFQQLVLRTRHDARIRCENVALGDYKGMAQMRIGAQSVWSRIVSGGDSEAGSVANVPITTLDDFFSGGHEIGLLKTDCEGYDAAVLSGARELLSAGKVDAVYSEVNFRKDGRHGDFFQIHDYLERYAFLFYGLYEHSATSTIAMNGRDVSFTNALWIRAPATAPS
jgi:FkbM family methyltransferase